MRNKPDLSGDLKDWVYVARELRKVANRLGDFPTHGDLRKIGLGRIAHAAQKYHGGLVASAERMGFQFYDKPRPRGYWQEWKNVEKELKKIERELGHFPSSEELTKSGHGYLARGIRNYHGGYRNVRERIGGHSKVIREEGYWKEISNVRKELKELWAEHPDQRGKVPSAWWMQKNKYYALMTGINAYWGGAPKLRKRLGIKDEKVVGASQYKNKRQLKRVIEDIWEKHPEKEGQVPPDNWLREHGYKRVGVAIIDHHGGFAKVREELGVEKLQRYRGVKLDSWRKIEEEVRLLYEEHPELGKRLPSHNWMSRNGYSGLAEAIIERHGGFSAARVKLGEEARRRPDGALEDIQYVKKELRRIMREHADELKGKFPSSTWLSKNGHGSLYQAINENHGGIGRVRELMGFDSDTKPRGYWQEWKNVVREMREVYKETGKIPGYCRLEKMGRSSLGMAITKYHGGFPVARPKLEEIFGVEREDTKLERLLTSYAGGSAA